MTERPGIKAHRVALFENDSYLAYLYAAELREFPQGGEQLHKVADILDETIIFYTYRRLGTDEHYATMRVLIAQIDQLWIGHRRYIRRFAVMTRFSGRWRLSTIIALPEGPGARDAPRQTMLCAVNPVATSGHYTRPSAGT
jgi:hypothetical protein